VEAAGRNKDVLLVEGPSGPFSASAVARDLAEMPGARVVLLSWYREDLTADEIAQKAADIKGRLAGVVLNAVPRLRIHHVRTTLLPDLDAAGIPVLGTVPQDRALRASTIREIAEAVQGEVRFFPEKADALVEHIMIGALALDNGRYYFNQFNNKLVVTRWDRPDLQNAAVETDTVGFLLTGGQGPIPYMQQRVEDRKLPVIVVQEGTIALASRLDDAFSRGRLHPRKIERAAELLGTFVRLDGLTTTAMS
jgi:BioD-like phosphotransacetylase family protein